MALAQLKRQTYADYLALPASSKRHELVNGEFWLMAGTGRLHRPGRPHRVSPSVAGGRIHLGHPDCPRQSGFAQMPLNNDFDAIECAEGFVYPDDLQVRPLTPHNRDSENRKRGYRRDDRFG